MYEEVVLKLNKFVHSRAYMKGILQDVKTDSFYEEQADYLVYELETFVLTETLEDLDVRYPADWVQGIKERWLPLYLKKKFPVKYKYITYKAEALYPKISLPDRGPIVKVEIKKKDG